ncbi:hypothetical protein ACFYWX_18950 [Streptomyces sp. NPDC002888]|uniref:hypothetical protein n=1 Tax=Streptomyces sp. NPDC002888 TaxID=3364668 RepID=UPI00368DF441
MIVQWCVKGLALESDQDAKDLIDSSRGICCNWWRRVGTISPNWIRDKLTPQNLDLHINHFTTPDPATGDPFNVATPFISLSAGTVERDAAAQTNIVHRARMTALWFGTDFGRRDQCYLYLCWVVVAPRRAVQIEGVSEEPRDLNTYRRYSAYQTEGEITAKVLIPDNQIMGCEKWEWDQNANILRKNWTHPNPRFTPPETLSNVRELI